MKCRLEKAEPLPPLFHDRQARIIPEALVERVIFMMQTIVGMNTLSDDSVMHQEAKALLAELVEDDNAKT